MRESVDAVGKLDQWVRVLTRRPSRCHIWAAVAYELTPTPLQPTCLQVPVQAGPRQEGRQQLGHSSDVIAAQHCQLSMLRLLRRWLLLLSAARRLSWGLGLLRWRGFLWGCLLLHLLAAFRAGRPRTASRTCSCRNSQGACCRASGLLC